jgi:Na+-transporting NADH:ubiquinone oxidoreductase subunit B
MRVDLVGLQRTLLAALLPCAAAGVVVTGFGALSGDARMASATAGWRGELLRAAGVPPDAGSVTSCAAHGVAILLPLLAASAAAAYACAWGFARARGRSLLPGTAAAALVFALLLPADVPVWQAALAAAFGVIVGREVFGGVGRTFVHPAVVGLVFLQVAYPHPPGGLAAVAAGGLGVLHEAGLTWWDTAVGLGPGALGGSSALACLLGAVVLVTRGAGSWRVMAGVLAGSAVGCVLLAGATSFTGVPWWWHLTLGSLAFVAVFVATDPSSSAHTHAGRWWHGGIVGFLAIAIRVASPVHAEGAILAALLGSVLVPLVDHAVIRRHVRRRRRRG